MKCLRCGRELKDGQLECKCGHFYENNLNKKARLRKKKITLIEIVAVFIIFIILFAITVPIIKSYINNSKKERNNQSEYCDVVCENDSYYVKNNTCYCGNGQSFVIKDNK